MFNEKGEVRLAIEKELTRRAGPDGVIPHGVMASLAAQHGVSRERVSSLARRMGLRGRRRGSPRPEKPRYQCLCGVERNTPTLCLSCRQVEIPCDICGKGKVMLDTEAARRLADGRMVFCSRRCLGINMYRKREEGRAHAGGTDGDNTRETG